MLNRKFADPGSYSKNIKELIRNFIDNRDQYPEVVKLAVQPEVSEVVIDNPSECRNCDFYDVRTFISTMSDGKKQPNESAISQLVDRYFQVS